MAVALRESHRPEGVQPPEDPRLPSGRARKLTGIATSGVVLYALYSAATPVAAGARTAGALSGSVAAAAAEAFARAAEHGDEHAAEHGDEHAVKFTDTALDVAAATGRADAGWPRPGPANRSTRLRGPTRPRAAAR